MWLWQHRYAAKCTDGAQAEQVQEQEQEQAQDGMRNADGTTARRATDANPQTHLNACNAEEQRAARAIRNILAIEQIVDADLEEIAALAIEVKRVILLHKVHRGEQHLFEADL